MPVPSFGTVVTNTVCTASFLTSSNSTSGPASCTASAVIPDHPEFVAAISLGSISNTTTVGDSLSSSFVYDVSSSGAEGSGTATASGTNTIQLTSGGPVRPGYLSISEDYYSFTGFAAGATTTVSVGSYSQTCTQYPSFPPPVDCNVAPQRPGQTVTVPFTLGQPFTFSQTTTASATFSHILNGHAAVQLSLLEADPGTGNLHTVPLVLADAPEPQSFALFGLGLIGLVVLRRRAQRKPAVPQE